jgi:RLL motif-containing protein 1
LPPYSDATSSETLAALQPIFNALHLPVEANNKDATLESSAENARSTADQIRKIKAVLEAQVLPCLAAAARIPASSGDGAAPSAATVLSDFPLGFSTGDQGVDVAAMVLRMLYIKDTRELQDQIDAAIVKMQEITAEPKTDATMRKDGRG